MTIEFFWMHLNKLWFYNWMMTINENAMPIRHYRIKRPFSNTIKIVKHLFNFLQMLIIKLVYRFIYISNEHMTIENAKQQKKKLMKCNLNDSYTAGRSCKIERIQKKIPLKLITILYSRYRTEIAEHCWSYSLAMSQCVYTNTYVT